MNSNLYNKANADLRQNIGDLLQKVMKTYMAVRRASVNEATSWAPIPIPCNTNPSMVMENSLEKILTNYYKHIQRLHMHSMFTNIIAI